MRRPNNPDYSNNPNLRIPNQQAKRPSRADQAASTKEKKAKLYINMAAKAGLPSCCELLSEKRKEIPIRLFTLCELFTETIWLTTTHHTHSQDSTSYIHRWGETHMHHGLWWFYMLNHEPWVWVCELELILIYLCVLIYPPQYTTKMITRKQAPARRMLPIWCLRCLILILNHVCVGMSVPEFCTYIKNLPKEQLNRMAKDLGSWNHYIFQ